MKLATFIIFSACIQLSAAGFSQSISIKEKNVPLEVIIKKIEKQSGYLFWYKTNLLQKTSRIDINVESANIREVLDIAFAGQPLSYIIEKNSIILEFKRPQTLSKPEIIQKGKEVRGTVRDSLGVLPGVSVRIKGSNTGTVTGANGKYILDVPNEEIVLIFSMVGFISQEVLVKDKEVVNVTLKATSDVLDDVVVVAFGAQKKTTMVGSVTTINPKELKGPTSNLTSMFAGRVAGMIAYQRSGEPGLDDASFFIRGVTSFGTGKVNPLILIDGIELSSSDLARLQPDDIASFSILKDATASSLYGARGANGVVLVKTKSGTIGQTQFNVRFENSLSSNTRNFKYADNITYMNLANEAVTTRNSLRGPMYEPEKIDGTIDGKNPLLYPSNNWTKLMVKDYTMNRRLNLNVSGGVERAQYYIAGTFNEDNGVLKTNSLNGFNSNVKVKNYEVRSNIDVKLTPTTQATVRTTVTLNDYNGPYGGGAAIFSDALRSNPVEFPAVYDASYLSYAAHPLFGNGYITGTSLYNNPYANMLSGFQQNRTSNVILQAELKQDFNFITSGLSARMMAYTRRNSFFSTSRKYSPYYYKSIVDPIDGFKGLQLLNEGRGTEYLSYVEGGKVLNSYNYMESSINYDKTLGKHNINAMAIGLISNYLTANAGSLQSSLPSRNLGISGRLTYNYDVRYLVEFNFGYNGSERFDSNKRFGLFPSIGAAWNISNEAFFKNVTFINKLKLRGSYGIVGNDQIGNINDRFFYLSNVEMNAPGRGYYFGNEFATYKSGIAIYRYANSEITWEKARKTNIALELGLFNSLNMELEFYKEHRSNILMNRAYIPSTMGLEAPIQANVGEAEGKGIDLSLDYNKSFANKAWLQLRGTFTYAASKILINEEPNYSGKDALLSHVGRPISQVYGLVAERYFIDENEVANSPRQNYGLYQAGDIKYRDVNGDGQITNLDRVPIGHPTTPEIVYGLGFSYGYKGFDIGAFAQGAARSSFWIDPSQIAPFVRNGGNQNGLLSTIADSYWSESNRDLYAFYPRLSSEALSNNYQTSTWWMRNGAFLRLKTVELGYTLSPSILKLIRCSNVRVYLNGMNLFSVSKFKMWDTEMGGNGLGYPVQRVYNIGINLGFK